MHAVTAPSAYDGNLTLNDGLYVEEQLITGTATPNTKGPQEASGDIQVYLVGGANSLQTFWPRPDPKNLDNQELFLLHRSSADGLAQTKIVPRRCWVAGALQKDLKSHMHTIAHEVGHFIVGPGHPDEPEETNRGSAALTGTDHSHRLMVSGKQESRRNKLGLQLVKTEWDEADTRLKLIKNETP